MMSEVAAIVSAIWPILLAFVTLVIVLAKMEVRLGVVEEKVRSLFELWNNK
jgi:hypothetical protein